MKKRKEEILCNKEQSTVQSTVQSNNTYVYGVGVPAVLSIAISVFFTYNKKAGQEIHEKPINQNDVICFRKTYNK